MHKKTCFKTLCQEKSIATAKKGKHKKSGFHIKGSVWQEKDMNVLGQKKTQVKSADMTMAHSF